MINLSNFSVVPPQLRMALKMLPWVAILGLLIALGVTRNTLGNVRDTLKTEQGHRAEIATTLGVKNRWDFIKAQIGADRNSLNNYRVLIKDIDLKTAAAKRRADEADLALQRQQRENELLRKKSQGSIDQLQGRKPSGDEAKDRIQNEKDSQLPWKQWTQILNWSGADGYVLGKPEFRQYGMNVQIITYPTTDALTLKFTESAKLSHAKFIKKYDLRGFAEYTNRGVCRIHIVDPEVRWQPHVIGHELAHCMYGAWHEERIKM